MKKNGVVHFEIYADDLDKLGKFYTSLFDWTIELMPGMDYWYIKTVETGANGRPSQAGGINGGMMKRPEGYEGRAWINYVNVASIEESVARTQKLGAALRKGKTPVPGIGWFAMLTDPQGDPFAIWQMDPNAK
ncbi:MAG: VOC family protein [Syntrophales bacterium]|jgi:predicted enzyme related to lactoylglutathione lyase